MSDLQDVLVPQTSTPLAKALDAIEGRLLELPVHKITKDPMQVDAGLLDHLAWELSVDVWDSAWPELQKRSVIAASEEVHRFKGTPYAIKSSFAAFDLQAEILEWFDVPGADRGSFAVIAWLDVDQPWHAYRFDPQMFSIGNQLLRSAAPVSRAYSLRFGQRLRRSKRVALVVKSRSTTTAITAFPKHPVNVRSGGVVHVKRLQRIEVQNG
jgi:phage tail P2-like protein